MKIVQRWNSECLRCITTKYIADYPADAPENLRLEYQHRLLNLILACAPDEGGAVVTDYIIRLRKEMFGVFDDYTQIKQTFNAIMMEQEDWIRKDIASSPEPVYRALQYVMTGNYIDFGVMPDVNSKKLLELLKESHSQQVDRESYEALLAELATAKTLVLLTDNCGEIVLDKLLLEAIKAYFPHLTVTSIVRGAQALNDATMEDALQVGLDTIGRVIGSGSSIPGTHLPAISEESRNLIETADIVISKGQGNFETLRGCGLNIYYLFMCKCELFTTRFNKKQFEGMLISERDV